MPRIPGYSPNRFPRRINRGRSQHPISELIPFLPAFVIGVADHIDHHGTGQNQYVILAVSDLDAVSVVPAEPAFRDFRHPASAALEGVFHVQKTALGFKVVRAGNVHGELAAK